MVRVFGRIDLYLLGWLALLAALLLAINIPIEAQMGLAFAPIPAHAFGDPPFPISVTSPSPAEVTYRVESGPAVLSGSMLTLTSGGIYERRSKNRPRSAA